MSKFYHKSVSALLTFMMPLLMFFPVPAILGQSQQLCGREVTVELGIAFWSVLANEGTTAIAPLSVDDSQIRSLGSSAIIQAGGNASFPSDQVVLDNGNALAVLRPLANSTRRDDVRTLSIITQDGQEIILSDAQRPASLYWWQLLPEREPNHFGIFGYDNETTAFIVDVNWSPNGITIGQPQYLPFEFYPIEFYWAMLAISPDGEFVAYIQPTQTNVLEFFIYSLSENRYIWRTPYDGDGFVSVLWTLNSDLIALVSGTVSTSVGQIMGVSRNGEARLLADLTSVFGVGAIVYGQWGVPVNPYEVAFVVTSPAPNTQSNVNRLALLNLDTQQITDLCYSSTSAPRILGTSRDNIILEDTTAREIVVISAQTGDFSYIGLDEGVRPLPGTFEAGEATDTP